jgi:hypothetical protein
MSQYACQQQLLASTKECVMNITLSDKEYRIIQFALSVLSSNVDDYLYGEDDEYVFEDSSIHENEVIELRERLSSSAGLDQV